MLLSEVEGAAAAAAAAPRNEPPARDGTQDDAPASAAGGPSSSLKDRFRALLLAEPTSAASLGIVESAICCIAFDRASPASKEEVAQLCLGGRAGGTEPEARSRSVANLSTSPT